MWVIQERLPAIWVLVLAKGAVTQGVTYKAGTAIAADLSLYGNNTADDGSGLTYGVALSNLGSKIGYTDNALSKDYIPANLGAGIAYTWFSRKIINSLYRLM